MQRWQLVMATLVAASAAALMRWYEPRISPIDNAFMAVLATMELIQGPLYGLAASNSDAIAAVRAQWISFPLFQPTIPPNMIVRDIAATADTVALCVFRRSETPADAPLLVWLHGGGFVFGRARSQWAVALADHLALTVVSVELPLAPDATFPAIPQYALHALRYVHEHRDAFGASPASPLGVGGMSTGGTVAAAVALMAAQHEIPLAAQLLVAPLLDWPGHSRGYLSGVGHRSILLNLWFFHMYLGGAADAAERCVGDWRCTPASVPAQIASAAPAAIVVVGELDALKEEAVSYARKLEAAGIQARILNADATHMGVIMRLDRADRAWSEMLDAVRRSPLMSAQ